MCQGTALNSPPLTTAPLKTASRFFSATAPAPACNPTTTATRPCTRCVCVCVRVRMLLADLQQHALSRTFRCRHVCFCQAVREGHLDIVQLLLAQGADATVINVAGACVQQPGFQSLHASLFFHARAEMIRMPCCASSSSPYRAHRPQLQGARRPLSPRRHCLHHQHVHFPTPNITTSIHI